MGVNILCGDIPAGNYRKAAAPRASVLILAVWALSLLSVFAVSLAVMVRQQLTVVERVENRVRLYAAAQKGVHSAIVRLQHIPWATRTFLSLSDISAPADNRLYTGENGDCSFSVGYSLPEEDYAADGAETIQFYYGCRDTQSKININHASVDLLKQLLSSVTELTPHQIDIVASSIIDWRDSDNKSLPNGAEDAFYRRQRPAYSCKNAAIESLEELRSVRGVSAYVWNRLLPYITVYGDGLVNINTAPAPVLAAMGLDGAVIKKILRYRCGPDGIPVSADDRQFASSETIVSQLSQQSSLSPEEAARLSNAVSAQLLGTFSRIGEIESTASRGNRTRQQCIVTAVFRQQPGDPPPAAGRVLSWRTRYVSQNFSAEPTL